MVPLLAGHAAAGVEHEPKADRHALRAEVRDLLRHVVFVDDEVVLLQAGDEAARRVGDRRGDVDQLDARAELEPVLSWPGWRLCGAACDCARTMEPASATSEATTAWAATEMQS